MDGTFMKISTVCSVSDQEQYDNYPPLVANIPFAILPEQAGVWNIAVDCRAEEITDEMVIMASVNALYGVMHLCSRLDKLTDIQKEYVKEAIAYYRSLANIKDKAFPIFPNGFANVDDKIVCTGLKHNGKLYMSVYNLFDEEKEIKVDLSKYKVKNAALVYPKSAKNAYELKDDIFTCVLQGRTARSFEIQ